MMAKRTPASRPSSQAPLLPRRAAVRRKTRETDVQVFLDLDGRGTSEVKTGIGFFDHMLTSLATHARFDLKVQCAGDLHIDAHHTVEDVGICLGDALEQALGEKQGIARFGYAYVPLDEALARSVVDLSGRAYFYWDAAFAAPTVGTLPTELIEEFFRAFAQNARINLHLEILRGRNAHHMIEALFKALARALASAAARDARLGGVPSTKGSL